MNEIIKKSYIIEMQDYSGLWNRPDQYSKNTIEELVLPQKHNYRIIEQMETVIKQITHTEKGGIVK